MTSPGSWPTCWRIRSSGDAESVTAELRRMPGPRRWKVVSCVPERWATATSGGSNAIDAVVNVLRLVVRLAAAGFVAVG